MAHWRQTLGRHQPRFDQLLRPAPPLPACWQHPRAASAAVRRGAAGQASCRRPHQPQRRRPGQSAGLANVTLAPPLVCRCASSSARRTVCTNPWIPSASGAGCRAPTAGAWGRRTRVSAPCGRWRLSVQLPRGTALQGPHSTICDACSSRFTRHGIRSWMRSPGCIHACMHVCMHDRREAAQVQPTDLKCLHPRMQV